MSSFTIESKLRDKYPEILNSPVRLLCTVLWGDMDSAQHVNNLVYLKWSESARINLFGQLMDTSFKGVNGPILVGNKMVSFL